MFSMKLLIVLVNYHGSDFTIACLESLRSELAAMPHARVALCENGSGSDQAALLASAIERLEMGDRVTLTILPQNLGFTGGNNAVIRPALESADPPEYVLLLNNDTLVTSGSVVRLIEFLDAHPEAGLCGSRLEYPDGTSQMAARRTMTAMSEFDMGLRFGPISRLMARWSVCPPEQDEPHRVDWVPGAALLIRRNVLEEVGLLDEGLYTYFDDVDYCLRAQRAGWPTWYVPDSRVVHFLGQTTGVTDRRPRRRPDYWFLARRRYFLKNHGPWHAAAADAAAISGLTLGGLRRWISRKQDPDPPRFLWDIIRHSVFVTGFAIQPVPNPALPAGHSPPRKHQPRVA